MMVQQYRVTYCLIGKNARLVASLQEYQGMEHDLAERVKWYQDHFHTPVSVLSVEPCSQEWMHGEVVASDGTPLCWFCLDRALAVCFLCGYHFCGEHAWAMRSQVRTLCRIPAGQLAVECSECVCK